MYRKSGSFQSVYVDNTQVAATKAGSKPMWKRGVEQG